VFAKREHRGGTQKRMDAAFESSDNRGTDTTIAQLEALGYWLDV